MIRWKEEQEIDNIKFKIEDVLINYLDPVAQEFNNTFISFVNLFQYLGTS